MILFRVATLKFQTKSLILTLIQAPFSLGKILIARLRLPHKIKQVAELSRFSSKFFLSKEAKVHRGRGNINLPLIVPL